MGIEKDYFIRKVWKARYVYLLFLPTFIYFLFFSYMPFYGLQIAFKDFKIFLGMGESEWVGFKHFQAIFADPMVPKLIFNTIKISLYRIIFGFPVPIIFALLLNEVTSRMYKRIIQTVSYFPHFLSWVVYAGVVFSYIGPNGVFNNLIKLSGGTAVNFNTSPDYFIPIVVISGVLKGFGWGAIIYLAAISGIDPQLYDAACIDGAGRLKQIWHVTLPAIRPIIALTLCLNISTILDAGFDQIYMFLNNNNKVVGEIIDTYVYKIGLLNNKYEYATAVGLMKGIVSTILIISANKVIRKMGEKSLW